MPSTTTTTVSLGPIRDLPGPGAPGSGPDQDQPSFDKLLRPLARNAAAARTKLSSDPADAAPNQSHLAFIEDQLSSPVVANDVNDPSQSQDEQAPAAELLLVESLAGLAIMTPPIIAIDAPITAEESLDVGDQAPSDVGELAPSRASQQLPGKHGEQVPRVIGELLSSKTSEQAPSVISEQIRSNYIEPSPSPRGDQPTSAPDLSTTEISEVLAAISETPDAPITPIGNSGQSELMPDATSDAPASTNSTPAESRANQSLNVSQQNPATAKTITTASAIEAAATANAGINEIAAITSEPSRTVQAVSAVEPANVESPAPSPESPAIDLTRLENPSPIASSESTTDSRDQTNHDPDPSENPDPSETIAIDLATTTENSPAQPQTALQNTNQAPAAAPPASPPALTDSPHALTDSPHAVTTPSAATALASLPAPRIRLPADVLAQPATASNRRSTPAIDTKSLLTRVARAFAAAQERDGEIRLRLSPPELGSLRLELRIQDGVMVASLQTETDAARTAIIENLPALRERLSDQGVRIERFDVDLMHRQPGGTPDQPGHQQPEAPLAPLRVTPSPRPRSQPAPIARPSPAAASAGGLNVIV